MVTSIQGPPRQAGSATLIRLPLCVMRGAGRQTAADPGFAWLRARDGDGATVAASRYYAVRLAEELAALLG